MMGLKDAISHLVSFQLKQQERMLRWGVFGVKPVRRDWRTSAVTITGAKFESQMVAYGE